MFNGEWEVKSDFEKWKDYYFGINNRAFYQFI